MFVSSVRCAGVVVQGPRVPYAQVAPAHHPRNSLLEGASRDSCVSRALPLLRRRTSFVARGEGAGAVLAGLSSLGRCATHRGAAPTGPTWADMGRRPLHGSLSLGEGFGGRPPDSSRGREQSSEEHTHASTQTRGKRDCSQTNCRADGPRRRFPPTTHTHTTTTSTIRFPSS